LRVGAVSWLGAHAVHFGCSATGSFDNGLVHILSSFAEVNFSVLLSM